MRREISGDDQFILGVGVRNAQAKRNIAGSKQDEENASGRILKDSRSVTRSMMVKGPVLVIKMVGM